MLLITAFKPLSILDMSYNPFWRCPSNRKRPLRVEAQSRASVLKGVVMATEKRYRSNLEYVIKVRGSNVVLQGFTGSGKSYLACALEKEACRHRMRTCYIRIPDLEEEWRSSMLKPDGPKKLIGKYGSIQVLVLDEWLLDKPDDDLRSMIMELAELRCDGKSTIFCTQYQKKDWHARLRGGVHADAIMDWIVHNAVWLDSGKVNMRAKLSRLEG